MAGLYLDLGWDQGWSLVRRGDSVTSGVVNFRRQSNDDGVRLLAGTQWLTATLIMLEAAGERLDEIFYEEITFVGDGNGPKAMHAHGKQLGNVERWAALKKLRKPRGIPFNTVKKHITGHGSASQQTILKEMQRHFGPTVTDHNQASALAVMCTACGLHRV